MGSLRDAALRAAAEAEARAAAREAAATMDRVARTARRLRITLALRLGVNPQAVTILLDPADLRAEAGVVARVEDLDFLLDNGDLVPRHPCALCGRAAYGPPLRATGREENLAALGSFLQDPLCGACLPGLPY